MRRLVDYDESSSSQSSDSPGDDLEERWRLDLPPDFCDLYAVEARRGDDAAAFHDGRRRQVAHTPGLYPVHLFLPVPSFGLSDFFPLPSSTDKRTEEKEKTWIDLGRSKFGLDRDLHLSLTRPLFVTLAERSLLHHAVQSLHLGRVQLRLDRTIDTFDNDDGTRRFLVVRVVPCDALDLVCRKLGEIEMLSRAVLTQDHHISLAWSLSPSPPPSSNNAAKRERVREEQRLREGLAARLADKTIDVSCIKLKIGSTITSIPLSSPST